jgi:hypothetical protein
MDIKEDRPEVLEGYSRHDKIAILIVAFLSCTLLYAFFSKADAIFAALVPYFGLGSPLLISGICLWRAMVIKPGYLRQENIALIIVALLEEGCLLAFHADSKYVHPPAWLNGVFYTFFLLLFAHVFFVAAMVLLIFKEPEE